MRREKNGEGRPRALGEFYFDVCTASLRLKSTSQTVISMRIHLGSARMKNKTKRQRDEGETKGNVYGKRQSLEGSEVSVAMGSVDAA